MRFRGVGVLQCVHYVVKARRSFSTISSSPCASWNRREELHRAAARRHRRHADCAARAQPTGRQNGTFLRPLDWVSIMGLAPHCRQLLQRCLRKIHLWLAAARGRSRLAAAHRAPWPAAPASRAHRPIVLHRVHQQRLIIVIIAVGLRLRVARMQAADVSARRQVHRHVGVVAHRRVSKRHRGRADRPSVAQRADARREIRYSHDQENRLQVPAISACVRGGTTKDTTVTAGTPSTYLGKHQEIFQTMLAGPGVRERSCDLAHCFSCR
jgi:hypothetical protein